MASKADPQWRVTTTVDGAPMELVVRAPDSLEANDAARRVWKRRGFSPTYSSAELFRCRCGAADT